MRAGLIQAMRQTKAVLPDCLRSMVVEKSVDKEVQVNTLHGFYILARVAETNVAFNKNSHAMSYMHVMVIVQTPVYILNIFLGALLHAHVHIPTCFHET